MSDFKKQLQEEMRRIANKLGMKDDDPLSWDSEMKTLTTPDEINGFIEQKTTHLDLEFQPIAKNFLKTRISAVREEGKGKSSPEG